MNMGPSGSMIPVGGPQTFINPLMSSQRPPSNIMLPTAPGMNDSPLEFNRKKDPSESNSSRWRSDEDYNASKGKRDRNSRKNDRRER